MDKQQFAPNSDTKLTGKQQAMIIERIKDPLAPNSEIIKRAGYKINGTGKNATNTASQIYLENMRNPEIASRLVPVVDEIEDALITTVRRYQNSDKLDEVKEAMTNARWIHDKVKGKAVQQIQTTSNKLSIHIDLTGSLEEE